mmetsp:Transcript_37943/g.94135  ORF Transcript_37943/g.94135 Transcript_37943/m.94135 type:complete len:109 (-) Transcript_37943:140-466(-)
MLWLAAVAAVLEKSEQPRGATKAAEEAEQMLADTRGEIAISGSGCGSCLMLEKAELQRGSVPPFDADASGKGTWQRACSLRWRADAKAGESKAVGRAGGSERRGAHQT